MGKRRGSARSNTRASPNPEGSKRTECDILFAENGPELMTFQLDTGWAHLDRVPVIAMTQIAGLNHFAILQDNAADRGESLAATRANEEGFVKSPS